MSFSDLMEAARVKARARLAKSGVTASGSVTTGAEPEEDIPLSDIRSRLKRYKKYKGTGDIGPQEEAILREYETSGKYIDARNWDRQLQVDMPDLYEILTEQAAPEKVKPITTYEPEDTSFAAGLANQDVSRTGKLVGNLMQGKIPDEAVQIIEKEGVRKIPGYVAGELARDTAKAGGNVMEAVQRPLGIVMETGRAIGEGDAEGATNVLKGWRNASEVWKALMGEKKGVDPNMKPLLRQHAPEAMSLLDNSLGPVGEQVFKFLGEGDAAYGFITTMGDPINFVGASEAQAIRRIASSLVNKGMWKEAAERVAAQAVKGLEAFAGAGRGSPRLGFPRGGRQAGHVLLPFGKSSPSKGVNVNIPPAGGAPPVQPPVAQAAAGAPPPQAAPRVFEDQSALANALGTREEWMQSKLGSKKIGTEAYELESRNAARTDVENRAIRREVEEKLTDDSLLSKYLPKPVAGFVSNKLRKLPFDLGEKFGVTPGRQAKLFDAVEGIKELDSAGNPVFGTAIYELDQNGNKVFKAWRQDAATAQANWSALTPKEQEAAKWAVRKLEHERVVDNVNTTIEGYMRHYFKGGILPWLKKTVLREKVPGFLKQRAEAPGFIHNFEESLTRRLQEGATARNYNSFVNDFAGKVSEPIPASGIPKGWTEVTDLPGLKGKRMIPEAFHDEFKRIVQAPKEMSAAAEGMRRLGAYWKANMLTRPGTAARNAISGAIQYATHVVEETFQGIVRGDLKRMKSAVTAPVKALFPSNIKNLPAEIWGGKGLGSEVGQFGKGEGVVGKAIDAALAPMQAVENYWKRTLALSKLDQLGFKVDQAAIMASDDTLSAIIRKADEFGFDYRNVPPWLEKFGRHPLGSLTVPFAKYPMKLWAHFFPRYLGALNPMKSMPMQDRIARILTLATMAGGAGAVYSSGPDRRFSKGMDFDVDTTGRTFLGKGPDGKERWVRTKDQPWMNLVEFGSSAKDALTGRGLDRLQAFAEEYIAEGPLLSGFLAVTGKSDRWNENTPFSAKAGDLAKGFVPFAPVTEGVKQQLGGQRYRPETFWDALRRGIPGAGMDGKPVIDPQTKQPVLYEPTAEAMKFWIGVNLKMVDPNQYEAEKQREIRLALKQLNKAQTPREIEKARDRVRAIDPDLAEKMFEGIHEYKIEVAPEKASELMPTEGPGPSDLDRARARARQRIRQREAEKGVSK